MVAAIFVVVNAGGTLPIPLYVLWQPRFGFGPGILTMIFAAYAVVADAKIPLRSACVGSVKYNGARFCSG